MQDNPRYNRQIYGVDRVLFVERLSELTLIVPSLESFKGFSAVIAALRAQRDGDRPPASADG
jgi:hypothetical protein